jgi:hypothetical protein
LNISSASAACDNSVLPVVHPIGAQPLPRQIRLAAFQREWLYFEKNGMKIRSYRLVPPCAIGIGK